MGSVVSDNFTTDSNQDIGDLNSSVFANSATGLFTYTHAVTPGVDDIDSLSVSFVDSGFNGIAGYDFSQANLAGGNGDGTDLITLLSVVRRKQLVGIFLNGADSFFDAGETITFFGNLL